MKSSIKSFKPSIKLPAAEEQINKKIKNSVKEKIKKEVDIIIREINKKTVIYSVLSVVGLFLIFIPVPEFILYILFFMMTPFIFYLLVEFIKSIKKIFNFIDNFDKRLKTIVENIIKKERPKSLKSLIGFQLSGHDKKSITNLVISYSVKELIYKLKKKKKIIFIRIAAYTVIVLLFKEIFIGILKTLN